MKSDNQGTIPLTHGGQLNSQVQKFKIARELWLDLSTGISPYSYPSGDIPTDYWRCLPEQSQSFNDAVSGYYGAKHFLACCGSQAAIQAIPQLWDNTLAKVWLPKIGYKEHQKYWVQNGYSISHYTDLPSQQVLDENSVVVVINPNNPSGQLHHSNELLELARHLKKLNGLLIVDEAFIETDLAQSLTVKANELDNLLVLRSLGKFFGLAGARLGFVFSSEHWLSELSFKLGEWPISGSTLYLAEKALSDTDWQTFQTSKLSRQSDHLHSLLRDVFGIIPTGNRLFQTIQISNASVIFEQLCKQGIYVRLTDDHCALRFGIPDHKGLEKLTTGLSRINVDSKAL